VNGVLVKTYKHIINIFEQNNGYMNFANLKENGVTTLQIKELEQEKIIEKFARGWYWCNECGFTKPADYKYIEIAKVYPKAVMCMESACFLNGILREEPEIPTIATDRTDRGKIELIYPIKRYYFQNTHLDGEIKEIYTEFGSYRFYSEERTLCDCIRMKNKISEEIYIEILNRYKKQAEKKDVLYAYAKKLRALESLKNEEKFSVK
jgi:hypothetical protein